MVHPANSLETVFCWPGPGHLEVAGSRDRMLGGIFRDQKDYSISGPPRMLSDDLRGFGILLDQLQRPSQMF